MKLPYYITHRVVWCGFSQVNAEQVMKKLAAQGITYLLKTHQSTVQSGAIGQLASYQMAYDIYVRNEDYERAKTVLK